MDGATHIDDFYVTIDAADGRGGGGSYHRFRWIERPGRPKPRG
jgi:hypothetical protein